jgi:hypothetical protein
MFAIRFTALLALAAAVLAQSPAGPEPIVMTSLKIQYGENEVSPAGEMISRNGMVPPILTPFELG